MALTVRDGAVTVTLSDDLERLARAAVEQAIPGALAVMEQETAELADFARDEWPVKTGKSRAGLVMRTVLDMGSSSVKVEIRNDVEYAIFVKPAAWHGATTAWQRLVRGPMGSLHKELAERLGPVIVEALRRGVRGG